MQAWVKNRENLLGHDKLRVLLNIAISWVVQQIKTSEESEQEFK